MKGGYKIIDFKNVSLSDTPVTMTDVLVDLLNNYEKVVLLSHVVLSGSAKDDCFSTVLSDGAGGVKLNCYDGYISINSSGAVTYTVASASGMAENIAGLQNNLADTDNMIAPVWSATATYTKNSIVRDGGRLYKAKSNVPTGTATSNITYWEDTSIGELINNSIELLDLNTDLSIKLIGKLYKVGNLITLFIQKTTEMITYNEEFNVGRLPEKYRPLYRFKMTFNFNDRNYDVTIDNGYIFIKCKTNTLLPDQPPSISGSFSYII